MSKKHGRKLATDKQTDYLFDYFMNEEKIDDQMRGHLDEEIAKKLENHQPKLDSRIMTDKGYRKGFSTDEEEQELPTISPDSDDNIRPNVDFNDDDDLSYSEVSQSSVRSPYAQKINAVPMQQNARSDSRRSDSRRSDYRPRENDRYHEIVDERQLLGEKLVADVQKYIETPEERRARARENYSNLQDLVERHGVKLTKHFSIDDDPDEMAAEHAMHKERRNKNNQVKFYKQILLNIVCGAEFVNEKYNPFEFQLKDWSKQVASDMDDYTEVLEEIYEKYKDRGGKMAPEIRLLFLIIMSGVTFHLTKALFGSEGLGSAIQNNPNILNKLLGGLMKGGGANLLGGGNNDEPAEAKEAPPNNNKILAAIRNHQNKNGKTENRSIENTTTEAQTETTQKASANEALAIERERRLLAEQRAAFESQLRKQNELHAAQINDLRTHINTNTSIPQKTIPQQIINAHPQNNYQKNVSPGPTDNHRQGLAQVGVNHVLSDASKGPRFRENPIMSASQYPKATPINFQQPSDTNLDMFASEIRDPNPSRRDLGRNRNISSQVNPARGDLGRNRNISSQVNPVKSRQQSIKKPNKIRLDEILDSLGNSSDIDLDDVIETSSRKQNKKNSYNLIKPITSTRKTKNNSATRSVTKKRRSDSGSDLLTTNTNTKQGSRILKL